MRWVVLLFLLASGCSAWSPRQPLDDPTCVRLDPAFNAEETEAALDAFEAWEPHPVKLDIAIGGRCANEIKKQDHQKFRRDEPAKMFTDQEVLVTSVRGQTDILINPHTDWAEIDADIGKPYCQLTEGLVHEIGHLFGMTEDDHADEDDEHSIMVPKLWGCTGRVITDTDRSVMNSIY